VIVLVSHIVLKLELMSINVNKSVLTFPPYEVKCIKANNWQENKDKMASAPIYIQMTFGITISTT
jgi:hypothetical protein